MPQYIPTHHNKKSKNKPPNPFVNRRNCYIKKKRKMMIPSSWNVPGTFHENEFAIDLWDHY
jgi:hypothetical protein